MRRGRALRGKRCRKRRGQKQAEGQRPEEPSEGLRGHRTSGEDAGAAQAAWASAP